MAQNAILIATNMAGRGTDILLGGNPTFQTVALIRKFSKKVWMKCLTILPNLKQIPD